MHNDAQVVSLKLSNVLQVRQTKPGQKNKKIQCAETFLRWGLRKQFYVATTNRSSCFSSVRIPNTLSFRCLLNRMKSFEK